MKIINFRETVDFDCAVTIGMFDGVHIGHQKLIEKTIKLARDNRLTPVVYTFTNHPVKEKVRKYLTTLEEKLYLLEKFGINTVYLAELNDKFMKTTAREFFERELLVNLKTRAIVVGEDFRFGFGKVGDVSLLKEFGSREAIIIESMPIVKIEDTEVSSSLIYNCIKDGKIERANKCLGYNFFISGEVEKGKGLGRHIGFPTANIKFEVHSKALPKNGVYVTLGEIGGSLFQSVANVGFNPTFEEGKKVKIEVHFLDINNLLRKIVDYRGVNLLRKIVDYRGVKDLYGQFVRLSFLKRIRDEKKFTNVDGLKKSITNDVKVAEEYFKQIRL